MIELPFRFVVMRPSSEEVLIQVGTHQFSYQSSDIPIVVLSLLGMCSLFLIFWIVSDIVKRKGMN